MILPSAFGRRNLKNAVEQWGRQRPWSQLEWSVHRGWAGRCWPWKELGLFKRWYLLKILSARYLGSFTLGKNRELSYGSWFHFITGPSGDRWENSWMRFIMKKSERQWLESQETASHLACCTETSEWPWASYLPSLNLIFFLHIKWPDDFKYLYEF